MKTLFMLCSMLIALPMIANAQIASPVDHFKSNRDIEPEDKILKWECDINGDGKIDILLALKSNIEKDIENHESSGWSIYIADAAAATYTMSTGTEYVADVINVDDMPLIDTDTCYVGQITEIGKQGIVTMQIVSPQIGESVGKIFAYTVNGDHITSTLLAEYTIVDGPHEIFTKYLAENKRTHVQLHELVP